MKLRCSFALLVVAIVIGCAPPIPSHLVVTNDLGGPVVERAELIDRLAAAGTQVTITGDFCASACLMYLGLPGAVLTPQTDLYLHGLYDPSGAPVEPDVRARVERTYENRLPPDLARYWRAFAANLFDQLIRLNGQDVLSNGWIAVASAHVGASASAAGSIGLRE